MSLAPRRGRQLHRRSSVLQHVDDHSDAELVEASLAGRRRAFDVIVERYEPVLYNVAVRLLRDQDEALDVVQTTFVRAWDHLGSFDRSRRLFSWLYRIAVNVALNTRAKQRPSESLEDVRLESMDRQPDELVNRLEQSAAIEAAIGQLPEHYREVVLLRHFSELSYEEIAHALDIEVKTVKSRLFTARRQLADLLSEFRNEARA